jgi:hypothetical protein
VDALRLDASFVDHLLVAACFAVVLLIGSAARRRVSVSLDFSLPGRSLPAWVGCQRRSTTRSCRSPSSSPGSCR